MWFKRYDKWKKLMPDKENKFEQKECFSKWYGWESPVGITLFFVGGSFSVFLLALAFTRIFR
jgi:hypothetical protein